ncbi:MAG: S41 family peptidase [Anaerolineae bacterium]|nr:S41 family peptidase [Anaerolineae bacterium]
MQIRHIKSGLIVFGLIVLLVATFWGGYFVGTRQPGLVDRNTTDDWGLLRQVRELLRTRFVGDIPDDRTQLYGAIRGLVGSYKDPHTTFLEPAPRRLERDEIRGHFGGIGATLSRDEAGALVVTVMRDRPAARAGVRDGDILLAVDGVTITADMPVRDVVDLIRGEEGTPVRLTLRRGGVPEPFEVVVTRERIEVPSVEWRVLNAAGHTGYVKISIFGERTDQELQTGLNELAAQGVDRLVLDLRGNGGGLVETAVDAASRFLARGVVLYEVRRGGQERFYEVKRVSSPAHDWPLAVLVDGGTASASEIVAGALQDTGRGVLIGEKTYGKGSVQEVHELADGSSLHVTVARWLTPARHQIDRVGLTPDVPVNISAADREAGRDPQLARAQEWLQTKQ